MIFNGDLWTMMLSMVSFSKLSKPEFIKPLVSTLFGAGVAAGVLMTQLSSIQAEQKNIIASATALALEVKEISKLHAALSRDYYSAIASRDSRVKNDDERNSENRRRIERLEERVFQTRDK